MLEWLKGPGRRGAGETAVRSMQAEARAYGARRRDVRARPGEVTDRGAKQQLMAEMIFAVGTRTAACC